ncbi:MAG: response regulator transcription factor [Ruminococcus sp.]|nr:response regulator transcription factor [Ruminococcus sp.]
MEKLIYAADDEQDILDVMQEFLQNAGFKVRTFPTGDQLYEAFREFPSDLVVLDIMMPGTDGLTICKQLRSISNVPIVILTAKESETDHMRGFMLGGDDYLIKPFSPSLLVIRIKALLRRMEMIQTPSAQISTFGDLIFSESDHTVTCAGKPMSLSMTEFSLLGCLMKHTGVAVSRDELLDRVWGIEATDIETRVTDETVRRIRQKLKACGSKVKIAAVWGYGYKLEAENE